MGAFIGQASDQALRRSLTLLKNVLVLDKDARAKVGERESGLLTSSVRQTDFLCASPVGPAPLW